MEFFKFYTAFIIHSNEFTIDYNNICMYVCQFLKLHLKQINVIEHKINSITPYTL